VPPTRVRFSGGYLAIVMLAGAVGAISVALIALIPAIEVEPSSARGSEVIAYLAQFRWQGISIPLVLFAAAVTYNLGQMARRWIDETAVLADDEGLRFHPSIRKDPLGWDEVRHIRAESRFGAMQLHIRTVAGKRFRITPCDHDEVRALVARFAAMRDET